jgi:class 3 adenylate cyclase/tetratricopeptide (TPR) repeat protein
LNDWISWLMSQADRLLRELELTEYLAAFRDNNIDDDILAGLSADDLKELGVTSLGHRKKILAAIEALREIEAPPEPPKPAHAEDPTEQRREVAVLFSDLTGYTKLINRLAVEDMHAILAGMYDRFDGIVRRMGGTVDRHIGDCVMAVFGAPVSYGNDLERALRCAAEMHDVMRELSRMHGEPLSVHVGVAAGRVLYSSKGQGALAESGFTVTGGTINLASRLADKAEGTETLISDRTYLELRGLIDAEAVENVEAQGFATPVTAYRFLGFRSRRADQRFVGRAAELDLAERALDQCLAQGAGQVLHLTGEAGIGKTSLLDQIGRRAVGCSFSVHRMLVLDFGLGGEETVVRSLLAQLTGLSTGATASAIDAVSRGLRQTGVLSERAAYLFSHAMGVRPEGAARLYVETLNDRELAEAVNAMVAGLVMAEAARTPRLIAVEDLHWADEETLGLVTHLAGVTTKASVLMVLTSREGSQHLDGGWQESMPDVRYTTLALPPLSPLEATELATLLHAPKTDLVRNCLEKAEGNPLFLAQLLHHANDAEADAVPGTIQSLVQSKIDRLSPDDRNVIYAAAVIGQRFRIDAATAIAGIPIYDPGALFEAGLVRKYESDLLFSHALIRDGVYQTILRNDLKRLHQSAADWFEPSDALLHAEHLEKAGSEAAAAAFARAAEEAAANRRMSASLALIERGLGHAPAPEVRARLNLLAGDILRDLGRGEASITAFRSVLDDTEDPAAVVAARIGLVGTMRIMDRLDETPSIIAEAVAIAEATAQYANLSKLHYLKGAICFPKGDFRGCLEANSTALGHAERVGDPELMARALSGQGDAYYAQGRMFRAHDVFEKCLDLCNRHNLVAVEAANRFMLGTVRIYMNQTEAALQDALRSAELAHDVGQLRPEIVSRLTAGWLLQSLARREEARAEIERGLEAARQLGAKRFEPFLKETLVRILASEGRTAEAAAVADEVLAQTRDFGAMNFIGPWVLATTAWTKDGPAAAALLDEGEALLKAGCVGHNYFRFYVYGMIGCLNRGEVARARRYCDALADYTSAEPTPWSDFYIAFGRAGADLLDDHPNSGGRLSRLAAEAERAGLMTAAQHITRLLAVADEKAAMT